MIKNGHNKESVNEIIDFVRRNKGIDYSLDKAHTYSLKAKEALKILPDSQSKIALEALVDFVIDRKN
jgi:octaprenyl-diphosphate synthase